MSKRSGFAVKITAFIEADPNDMPAMAMAAASTEDIRSLLEEAGFIAIKVESRFMLSKDIPDPAPVADADHGGIFGDPSPTVAPPGPTTGTSYRADQMPKGTIVTPTDEMPTLDGWPLSEGGDILPGVTTTGRPLPRDEMPPIPAALDRRGKA